jgi:hypothetical protein
MTPVTGGITDTQQDRFVFTLGLGKCFLAPGMPVNWIVGMLQEIRTGFID